MKTKNAAATNDDNTSNEQLQCTPKHPPFKIERAIFELLKSGPSGLTQPEAYAAYGESCLHTTINSFQQERGIRFLRSPDFETVRFFNQKPFNRYWIATEKDRVTAENLLNHYRMKRGLNPIHFDAWHTDSDKAA